MGKTLLIRCKDLLQRQSISSKVRGKFGCSLTNDGWFCASSEIARRANGGRFHLCPVFSEILLQCLLNDRCTTCEPTLFLQGIASLNEFGG